MLKDVLSYLASSMKCTAVSVSTQGVSLADLNVLVAREFTLDEVRELFNSASWGDMNKIVDIAQEPFFLSIMSLAHNQRSSIAIACSDGRSDKSISLV